MSKVNPPEPQELDDILTQFEVKYDSGSKIYDVPLSKKAKAAILSKYISRQKVEEALPKHKCKEEVCQADHSITQAIDDLRTKLGLE